MIKWDNDSVNVQYIIPALQVKLKKVRRNSLLNLTNPSSAISKQTSQKNNHIFIYIALFSIR